MISEASDISAHLTSWFQRKTPAGAVRRIGAFPAALSSDIGLQRDENQDRVAIARGRDFSGSPYILAALSDGIGGMKDGAACAAATLGNLFSSFFDVCRKEGTPENWLKFAAKTANAAVFGKLAGKGGATLSSVLVTADGKAYLLNVGDSRIYRIDGNQLTQLTVDDTIAGQLGHKVESHLGENLLQFIGIGEALEANVTQLVGNHTSPILLTSDGVHYLDQNWLGQLAHHASDPGIALRRITETAKWCGGHDNASAALFVPYLAIQEPFINSDINASEIWDPFGELQLLTLRGGPPQAAVIAQTRLETSPPPIRSTSPGAPATPPPALAKTAKSKRKRERRAKSQVQMGIDDAAPDNGEKGKVPQLKIEFPQKAN